MGLNIFRICRCIRAVLTLLFFVSIGITVSFVTWFGQQRARNLPPQLGVDYRDAAPQEDTDIRLAHHHALNKPSLLRERLSQDKVLDSAVKNFRRRTPISTGNRTLGEYRKVLAESPISAAGPPLIGATKVLLFGYFRGGTSFAGELFAQNSEGYYMFEPLHSLEAQFERSTNLELRGKTDMIEQLREMKKERQVQIIYGILNCKVDYLLKADSLLFRDINFLYRAKKLMQEVFKPLDCAKRLKKKNDDECFQHIEYSCRNASVVAIKENRLRMTQIEQLLKHDPNIYVIHYTRDPRGIASSAPYSSLAKSGANVNPKGIAQATYTCTNMLNDTLTFNRLKEKYQKRLFHIKYEDLGIHPMEVGEAVYNNIGKNIPSEVKKWLEINTSQEKDPVKDTWGTQRNSASVVYKWKDKLSKEIQTAIENIPECRQVLNELGYDK